jgi:hypothetical protein
MKSEVIRGGWPLAVSEGGQLRSNFNISVQLKIWHDKRGGL